MGGRGTYAAGNNPPYTYETVGMIEGVKVLSGLGDKHDLPVEAHLSEAYIQLYPDGNFKMLRFFDRLKSRLVRDFLIDKSKVEVYN